MEESFISRKMENNVFRMQEVEIIIPFHGEHTRVTKLMENIFNTISTNRYLITLVDDASKNESFIKRIKDSKVPGVRCFRFEEQKGFGAAINHVLTHPWVFRNDPSKVIKYVCIMHSDVLPEDNHWLFELGSTLERMKTDGIKMVSPKTNNPMSSSTLLVGERGLKYEDSVLEDYLPMYCALCNRELFARVGLFKEFPYAGVEVEDFAQRMKALGFKQGVSGKSWVHHEGGATLNNFAKSQKVQKALKDIREEFDRSKIVEVQVDNAS